MTTKQTTTKQKPSTNGRPPKRARGDRAAVQPAAGWHDLGLAAGELNDPVRIARLLALVVAGLVERTRDMQTISNDYDDGRVARTEESLRAIAHLIDASELVAAAHAETIVRRPYGQWVKPAK
jgi:hypothetical protein